MRLKHFDYITLVTEAYNKKRAGKELSPLLTQSTPGNIRRECANVYQERFEKKDEQMLRAFFGPADHGRKFLALIQEFDADRFRPLDKYLKGDGKKALGDRNLELLAWLIDFKHRPYSSDKEVLLSDEEMTLIKNRGETIIAQEFEENDLQKNEDEPENPVKKVQDEKSPQVYKEVPVFVHDELKNRSEKGKSKKAIIIFLMLVICTGGIFIVWKQMGNVNTVCGYWAGDHYEEVPCTEDPKGRIILTMNREKMQRFRKITLKDTMTEWSIGKAYYIQNKDTIECYTEAGKYPEDLKRNLRVLSSYMFKKHLGSKATIGKDSLSKQDMKSIINR